VHPPDTGFSERKGPLKKESLLPYLWMLSGSFSFAVMACVTHVLGPLCDWQVIALLRAFLALVFSASLALSMGARLVVLGPPALWMRSLAGSFSLVCTFFAFTRLPVSDVLTLTNVFPIWVAVLSWPMLGERPSLRVWLCVASGVLGVVLIQQPHFAEGNFACLVALASSVSTAFSMIGLHRLGAFDPRAIVAHFSGVAIFFCIGSLFAFDHSIHVGDVPDRPVLLMLLAVGITATIGQIFLTKAFAAGPAAKVSVVGLSQIVFAMLFDVSFAQRSFNPTTLLGIGLVMAPVVWLLARPTR
jgi:drug/metabolite transporter (DMT)-like permease